MLVSITCVIVFLMFSKRAHAERSLLTVSSSFEMSTLPGSPMALSYKPEHMVRSLLLSMSAWRMQRLGLFSRSEPFLQPL